MRSIISIVILLAVFTSCHNEHSKSPLANIAYDPHGELVTGTLDSTEYNNSYFQFTFRCPGANWRILNAGQYAQRLDDNKSDLGITDNSWETTEVNLHNLLTIEKEPASTNSQPSQSISFTAEGLEKIPNVHSALEYLNFTEEYCKKHLSSNYPKYTVTGSTTGLVGDRLFLVQSFVIENEPGSKRYQRTYTAQFKNYLLNIIVNYNTSEELEENEKLLGRVTWHKQ